MRLRLANNLIAKLAAIQRREDRALWDLYQREREITGLLTVAARVQARYENERRAVRVQYLKAIMQRQKAPSIATRRAAK